MQSKPAAGPDIRNLLISVVLATVIMFAWQYFYERPRQAAVNAQHAADVREVKHKVEEEKAHAPVPAQTAASTTNSPRVKINSTALHGSIKLTGLRFDDLTLADYHETADKHSPEVKLLDGTTGPDAYFAELGLLSDTVKVPDENTLWHADAQELSEDKPVTFTWSNGQGLTFSKKVALDDHYMFTITTTVSNNGGAAATLYPYGLVSRNYIAPAKSISRSHEGPLGVFNNVLEEVKYKTLHDEGAKKYEQSHGWIGMTDKYWLTAIIPDPSMGFDSEFKQFKRDDVDAYQADLRGEALTVPANGSTSFTVHMFAGAKVLDRLSQYEQQLNIPLFDRAVDYGHLYFIAKPLFQVLDYFYGLVGNFGVAILLLTVCLKILLFPLANKAMTSMSRMKMLQPQTQAIKERHSADKLKMNQEMMALYKREKVSPLGGCLPLLLQIPIFFALFRVLSVSIEMRQAPFFGWIHDLSVMDPSNLFTAFGYVPWNPPTFLHLGVWPIVYCISLVLQQRLNPKPADPVQAAMMTYMPFFMTFVFLTFPAGLVIYYSWNNTLTIFQQLFINRQLTKKGLR